MTKGEWMTPEEYIAMVEEENKNLRDYADNLDSENDNQAIEIEEKKKENKKLKAIIEHYKKFEEWKEKLKWMLMEEDTLQELRDIGEI